MDPQEVSSQALKEMFPCLAGEGTVATKKSSKEATWPEEALTAADATDSNFVTHQLQRNLCDDSPCVSIIPIEKGNRDGWVQWWLSAWTGLNQSMHSAIHPSYPSLPHNALKFGRKSILELGVSRVYGEKSK